MSDRWPETLIQQTLKHVEQSMRDGSASMHQSRDRIDVTSISDSCDKFITSPRMTLNITARVDTSKNITDAVLNTSPDGDTLRFKTGDSLYSKSVGQVLTVKLPFPLNVFTGYVERVSRTVAMDYDVYMSARPAYCTGYEASAFYHSVQRSYDQNFKPGGNTIQVKLPERYTPTINWMTDDHKKEIQDAVAKAFFDKREKIMFSPRAIADAMAPLVKEQTPVKIRNKYYVAAAKVTSTCEQAQDNVDGQVYLNTPTTSCGITNSGKWTRKTLASAVEHGEQMLAANDNLEHVAIVQIVRVVRRVKPVVRTTVEIIK